MHLRIRGDRVEALADALLPLGVEGAKRIERGDPQFHAASKLAEALGDPALAAVLVVANALISYRLTLPGEEYWAEFAEAAAKMYASGRPGLYGFFSSFLRSCRGNRRLADQKLARIRRLEDSGLPRLLEERFRHYATPEGLLELWGRLASLFGGREAKTVVFAVKMFYYVASTVEPGLTAPREILIPVDLRVALLAATSGIVVDGGWREAWRRGYGREKRVVLEAWRLVSDSSRIPLLHLDAVIWLAGRAAREAGYRGRETRRRAVLLLSRYSGGAVERGVLEKVAQELFALLG